MAKINFFLCHSSEDKKEIVRPVYEALLDIGKTAWLDEAEMTVGDSLTREIQSALSQCEFVVVFLSKSFLSKGWPQEELNASLNIQIATQKKRVLPIIIDISHEELTTSLPFLADKLHLRWQGDSKTTATDLSNALKKANTTCVTQQATSTSSIDTTGLESLVELTYIILRCDQIRRYDPGIPELSKTLKDFEGGWGKSTVGVLKPLFNYAPSDLVKWQGGITTCSLVGNTLSRFEQFYFQEKNVREIEYLKLMRTALLNAQNMDGGFGALVQTRDSVEIHPTYRHTAATLSFLLGEIVPRKVIKTAIDYLRGFLTIIEKGDPVSDTCPALALAWLFKVIGLSSDNGFLEVLNKDQIQKMTLDTLSHIDDEYYPYWKPYASSKKAMFWTSLTVISICPEIATTKTGSERLIFLLDDIFSSMLARGLPTYKNYPYPDIGITSLLAYALYSLRTRGERIASAKIKSFTEKFYELIKMIIDLRDDSKAFENTWCETLYPILSFSEYFKIASTPKRREQLDHAIKSMVLGEPWQAGEIILPSTLSVPSSPIERILNDIIKKYIAA
jgi:hypothetical protein